MYRFAAKNVFLTYANQDGNGWGVPNMQELFQFLQTIKPIKYIVLSKEQHRDGSDHYHAVIQFQRRFDTTNPRVFDFNGWHPKIESPRSIRASINYVKKDGEFLEFGTPPTTKNSTDLHAKCKEMDRAEWEEFCIGDKIPFAYCESIWNRTHPRSRGTIQNEEFNDGELCLALQRFTWDFPTNQSLILIGPSGCGKTLWAKRNAPRPCLFISHIDRLTEFDERIHRSIIFDDMTFKHYPVQSQIHIADQYDDRDIHVRYKTAFVPKGIPKVFTCNEEPFDNHEAIQRRTKTYRIINLF